MNREKFLETVMNPHVLTTITICGSMRFYQLMQQYQAYYGIKGNVVNIPCYYKSIKSQFTNPEQENYNIEQLKKVHFKRIEDSDAILVVNGYLSNQYIDQSTTEEIIHAFNKYRIIMFTQVDIDNKLEECYFNNDKAFPIYIFKEDKDAEEE